VSPFTSSDNNPAIFWNLGSSIPFSANSFLVAVIVSAKIEIKYEKYYILLAKQILYNFRHLKNQFSHINLELTVLVLV